MWVEKGEIAWSKRLAISIVMFGLTAPLQAQEVIVLSSLEETITWLEAENWWGEENRAQRLTVPRAMIVAISENWQENAPKFPVATKKEIFYCFMLQGLIRCTWANSMNWDTRWQLKGILGSTPHRVSSWESSSGWLDHNLETFDASNSSPDWIWS